MSSLGKKDVQAIIAISEKIENNLENLRAQNIQKVLIAGIGGENGGLIAVVITYKDGKKEQIGEEKMDLFYASLIGHFAQAYAPYIINGDVAVITIEPDAIGYDEKVKSKATLSFHTPISGWVWKLKNPGHKAALRHKETGKAYDPSSGEEKPERCSEIKFHEDGTITSKPRNNKAMTNYEYVMVPCEGKTHITHWEIGDVENSGQYVEGNRYGYVGYSPETWDETNLIPEEDTLDVGLHHMVGMHHVLKKPVLTFYLLQ